MVFPHSDGRVIAPTVEKNLTAMLADIDSERKQDLLALDPLLAEAAVV